MKHVLTLAVLLLLGTHVPLLSQDDEGPKEKYTLFGARSSNTFCYALLVSDGNLGLRPIYGFILMEETEGARGVMMSGIPSAESAALAKEKGIVNFDVIPPADLHLTINISPFQIAAEKINANNPTVNNSVEIIRGKSAVAKDDAVFSGAKIKSVDGVGQAGIINFYNDHGKLDFAITHLPKNISEGLSFDFYDFESKLRTMNDDVSP